MPHSIDPASTPGRLTPSATFETIETIDGPLRLVRSVLIVSRRSAHGTSRQAYSQMAEERAVAAGSVVYYLRRRTDGLIKIGMSKNVDRRIEWLQDMFGPLLLLGTEPGGRATEVRRHRQFITHHVTDLPKWHGVEWFRPHRKLYAHIKTLAGGQ